MDQVIADSLSLARFPVTGKESIMFPPNQKQHTDIQTCPGIHTLYGQKQHTDIQTCPGIHTLHGQKQHTDIQTCPGIHTLHGQKQHTDIQTCPGIHTLHGQKQHTDIQTCPGIHTLHGQKPIVQAAVHKRYQTVLSLLVLSRCFISWAGCTLCNRSPVSHAWSQETKHFGTLSYFCTMNRYIQCPPLLCDHPFCQAAAITYQGWSLIMGIFILECVT